MSSKDYWARRYKAMEEAILDKAYADAENLEKQFNTAIHDIDTQMRVWYQRFAKNNDISIADARRMLTSGELKEFKWTVEEYIQKGRESNLSDEWLKELENASARVHISRLDSLKMQLQHKAEELAAVKLKATEDAASLAYTESYYHTAFEFQKKLGYGWTMQALDENALKKVLSKPWTADGKTFTARCWEDKAKLVETVNRELTRMIATGAAPDKAIERIAKIFNTSKTNAGKLVMTESAFFASAAQRDSFSELGVEQYKIVGTLDGYTCDVCGDMDSQVFDMKDFAPGSTAPPFHPWCRCATCPYYEDMEGLGERFARDVETGERYKVPSDMTYKQWKAKQDEAKDLTNQPNDDKLILSTYVNSHDKLFENAKNIPPIDGYEDVVIHGNKNGFEIRDTRGETAANYTPRELAEMLMADPNYHGGDIRLISCEAGAEGAIAAQALAKQLGVNVLAPSDVVIVYPDGTMKIGFDGQGKWVLFRKE